MIDTNLDVLVQPEPLNGTQYFWGQVAGVSPLLVVRDGEDNTPVPANTVCRSHVMGERVYCIYDSRQVTILGVAGGMKPSQPKILWQNAWYMSASHTVNLAEPISVQEHGVVLAWSSYTSGAADNGAWNFTFIPKTQVLLFPNNGVSCLLSYGWKSDTAVKYVYVKDTQIVGHANNGVAPNNGFVLRYVVGI